MKGHNMKTFAEWVLALDEAKKGIVPDFIADRLKSKEGGDKKVDHKEAEAKPGKKKKK